MSLPSCANNMIPPRRPEICAQKKGHRESGSL
jgi:hypothetical protein